MIKPLKTLVVLICFFSSFRVKAIPTGQRLSAEIQDTTKGLQLHGHSVTSRSSEFGLSLLYEGNASDTEYVQSYQILLHVAVINRFWLIPATCVMFRQHVQLHIQSTSAYNL